MSKIKIESQWNGQDEMMINIPYFPHLHSSLNFDFQEYKRYPHPLEYFLLSLTGTITLVIKSFADREGIFIKNLFITIESQVNPVDNKFTAIYLELKLDSNATPEELTKLQQTLIEEEPIFSLINQCDIITINWD